jgi:hypothetical protein
MNWWWRIEVVKRIAFTLFLSVILLNLACSSTSQNSTSQDLEMKNVETLPPANQFQDEDNMCNELVAKIGHTIRVINANETITTINGKITEQVILEGRDLSIYEKADTDQCGTRDCMERKMREFIWQHWENKKRGYISRSTQGMDITNSYHIFIEPNDQGEWFINWKSASKKAMLGNDLFEILELVPVKKINNRNRKYELELINKDGEVLIKI